MAISFFADVQDSSYNRGSDITHCNAYCKGKTETERQGDREREMHRDREGVKRQRDTWRETNVSEKDKDRQRSKERLTGKYRNMRHRDRQMECMQVEEVCQ